MKKKLLFSLFVAIMLCLFAFTVSAANEVTLTDGTQADFATVFKVNSSNQVTGFNTDYDKDSIKDVTFPDEIEGIEANFLFSEAANLETLTFAATDTFFISGDGIFSSCSVKKITFNPNCIVELRKGNFSGCTSLTEITFPKFSKLAGSAFKSCSNMAATNALVLAEGMTEIGGHVFNGCTSLSGTVYFPSTLTTIQEYSFQNTGFSSFDLSKCANLTAVGGGYGGPFTDNDNITTLDLSGCTSLTALKSNFAANCDNLTEVILPPNLETIPHKAFAHCYKLQSIVLPASVTSVADEAFHSARKDQDIKTFTVYLQSNVAFHETYSFRDSSAKIEFVLIGDGVTAESFQAANTYSAITNATIVDYLDSTSPWTYVPGQAITAHTIVKNYCKPLALTGEHQTDDNPCVINCTVCKLSTPKENPVHDTFEIVTYANGFDNAGVYAHKCKNTGCTYEEKISDAASMFTCLGYSFFEGSDGGITMGYKIDNDAIKFYESKTNNALSYGLYVAFYDSLGENAILNEDGTPSNGVLKIDIENKAYSKVTVKITGIKTEEQKATKLLLGAYVVDENEEETKISYLEYGTKDEGGKYSYVTYNYIAQNNQQA